VDRPGDHVVGRPANPAGTTGLGYVRNDGAAGVAARGTFGPGAGEPVGPTDVLVKYTYLGDADLSGRVDGDDYFYVDSGYPMAAGATWAAGDFDHNGRTDGDDYFHIDNAYGGGGGL
jgi:hypothetical protein